MFLTWNMKFTEVNICLQFPFLSTGSFNIERQLSILWRTSIPHPLFKIEKIVNQRLNKNSLNTHIVNRHHLKGEVIFMKWRENIDLFLVKFCNEWICTNNKNNQKPKPLLWCFSFYTFIREGSVYTCRFPNEFYWWILVYASRKLTFAQGLSTLAITF